MCKKNLRRANKSTTSAANSSDPTHPSDPSDPSDSSFLALSPVSCLACRRLCVDCQMAEIENKMKTSSSTYNLKRAIQYEL